MFDADRERCAALERRDRLRVELEAQEVNRRRLFVVFALEILVRDWKDARATFSPNPDALFDAPERGQRARAFVYVLVLDEHRRLPVHPVRHEGIVGSELVPDALLLERLFDAQHLLNLVTDGELVLEQQRHVLAEVHAARLLVLEHPGPEELALLGVGLQRHQALTTYARSALLPIRRRSCLHSSTPIRRRCAEA